MYLDEWLLDKTLENYMPSPIYWLLRRVPSARLQRIFAADENIFKLGEGIYDSAFEGEKANDIMSLCKSYRDPVTNLPPERRQILGEAAIFLSAGTDTTSVAVTYIAWALACNHTFSYEIRRELANIPDQKRNDIDVLKALPYLNAFIREVLRVHGPTPGFLERVVPPEGTCFQGHFIPGGTIVSGQSWTSHRDPLLYPDPLVIKPERWVAKVGDGWTAKRVAPEVYAGWFPFGQGPRACVGRPLAEIELLLVASTLARTFRLTPHASTTAESMRHVRSYSSSSFVNPSSP
ncbi:cytochrome P450 [Exidia glandulosa HHB12029]|uniref:Cytochrome P450 n=1 Tax=Exidia glandulosa HHB12029 TaxID=1314781 RepID=A0A165J5L8_EXIGL|nr:cytochrome P450 [Exidia glandulosa HHB12029]